ncbi:TPA: hypothetical protein MNC05_004038 [Klebsiella pneumoniae]|uniref:glycosyltransferase family 32 protein n=1 Tax=Klebsiella pneumoniae complex TaxID=3390273 RepID=UPI00081BC743|nr:MULTISPECIES: glycosyltransferase [Klebsiella]HDH1535494.1 hypothetical protein [Klebsiella quasipneumoniae subsp. similipneumoniae]EMA8104367.1 hypothetical protein [Klebsiella quasipneumoniae]MBC4280036.1 mannosyltransferase [Klebsiella pneumoniae]MCP6433644.1 hypothetical protein [Klebsiella pneumoniae]MCQ0566584.1 hypothetical protein [Klebsiella pneumoniae]
MIPKVIHYCWFGRNEMPEEIKKFTDNIKKLTEHGYKVIEWNEDNYIPTDTEFYNDAILKKKWAHVSDYARLDILYQHGGIYLDTDIEIVRNFDELLRYNFFLGYMWDCNLGTAVIGSEKGNKIIYDIRALYVVGKINLNSPNNDLVTKYFINEVADFKLNGRHSILSGGVCVMDKYSFEHPSFNKRKNYTIHHFSQTWKENSGVRRKLKEVVIKIMGLYLYRKYLCVKSFNISPFKSMFTKD